MKIVTFTIPASKPECALQVKGRVMAFTIWGVSSGHDP